MNTEKKEKQSIEKDQAIALHDAVFSVGTFKPKFNPGNGKVFSDELSILGTAFLSDESKALVTCAHVVDNLLKQPLELAGLLGVNPILS